jgi:tRNA(Ile)-lysidine synthetase-like protein
MEMTLKFLKTLRDHHLIPSGSHIVVAVSGGADSLTLLHLLYTHRDSLNCTLHVATLDHRLRGEAGAADAGFVAETVQSWGLPVIVGNADVPALAKERNIGIEAAARAARYDFLAAVAKQVGAERVAVAHHADDQAETVLMHLLRGAGLDGLAGMGYSAPVVGHSDLKVIRPLLGFSRVEIEAYCHEHDLQPRQDATNEDTSYTRNRLRREVLPYLESLYPQVKRSLVQLADIASVENDYVEAALEQALIAHSQASEGRIAISRTEFAQAHPALQRRFVRWATRKLGFSDDLGYEHVISAIEIGLNGKQGAVAQLPQGLQLRVDYEVLVVERQDAPPPQLEKVLLIDNQEIPIIVPGVTQLTDKWNELWALHAEEHPTSAFAARLHVPTGSHVVLRTCRKGDRFAPLGMKGHSQKINQWMINHKLSRDLRDAIPLLEIDSEIAAILWGNQWAISERFAIRKFEERIIYLWLENPNQS